MDFNTEYNYIQGEVVDLKIIGHFQGDEKQLPYYWFEIISKVSGKPVGKISIRIGNNYHSYYNGNVGYEVDEAYRGHNYSYYASLMVMEVAKYHGLRQLHLACDFDNLPSQKVIEKLGGKLLETVVPPKDFIFYYDAMPAQRIYLLEID